MNHKELAKKYNISLKKADINNRDPLVKKFIKLASPSKQKAASKQETRSK